MNFTLKGDHLINGKWVSNSEKFYNNPISGEADIFSCGTAQLVKEACDFAEEAFHEYRLLSVQIRAKFLNEIANQIEKRADIITKIGVKETGLSGVRLESERQRTSGQLRFFAEHILKGDYLDKRHDEALPERTPLPRPSLYLIQRPVGPVGVFGASNFPLAFSVAGGDTASALAAGCSVVVKGHSSHPGTSEIVADAINAAIKSLNIHNGVFNLIQGGNREVGYTLVKNEYIKAIGFTGSFSGGKILFDLCAKRDEPIPFFGELGSVNPMFLLPKAINNRCKSIAENWANSLTLGAGQFCTNPGISVLIKDENSNSFIDNTKNALEKIDSQLMLNEKIVHSYQEAKDKIMKLNGVKNILNSNTKLRSSKPSLCLTDGANWFKNPKICEEVFGPFGLIVVVENFKEMCLLARDLKGQLTCSIHFDNDDENMLKELIQILEMKAGRIVANGYPTGVEVSDTMVHGGPYPASTNFGATSVGSLSIRRFLRPVCYQNLSENLFKN